VSSLSAENDELDYRVVTSDPDARRLILDTSGLRLIDAAESGVRPDSGVLVVRRLVPRRMSWYPVGWHAGHRRYANSPRSYRRWRPPSSP